MNALRNIIRALCLALPVVLAFDNSQAKSTKAIDGRNLDITDRKETKNILTNLPLLIPGIDTVMRRNINNGQVSVEEYYQDDHMIGVVSYAESGWFGPHSYLPAFNEEEFKKHSEGNKNVTRRLHGATPQSVRLAGSYNGGYYLTKGNCSYTYAANKLNDMGAVNDVGQPDTILRLFLCSATGPSPTEIIRKLRKATRQEKRLYKAGLSPDKPAVAPPPKQPPTVRHQPAPANTAHSQPAGASPAKDGPDDLARGIASFANQDYDAAFSHLKPLALRGIAAAQYYVGIMYLNGWGVQKSSSNAGHWMCEAHAQRFVLAKSWVQSVFPRHCD